MNNMVSYFQTFRLTSPNDFRIIRVMKRLQLWYRRRRLIREREKLTKQMRENFDLYRVAIRCLRFVQEQHTDIARHVYEVDRQLESLNLPR